MGGTQKRNKDSIFYEGDAVCHTCHQHECQCDANSRKAPDAPEVSNFGLWKNSILAGKEQKAKKKASVKESVTDYNPPSQGGTRKELLAKLKSAKTAAEKSDLSARARKAGASQDELKSASVDESTSESWSIRFTDGGKEERMTIKAATNKEALKKWRAKKPDAEIIGISRAKQVDESDNSFIVSTLRSAWNNIDRIDPDNPHYNKLIRLLDSLSQETLQELVDAKIKFVSNLARNRIKKSLDEGSDERLADLSKISTAKLQELVSLHRHAGGNNPLAAKAAKRGAEELLKRGIRVPMDETSDSDLNEYVGQDIVGGIKRMAKGKPSAGKVAQNHLRQASSYDHMSDIQNTLQNTNAKSGYDQLAKREREKGERIKRTFGETAAKEYDHLASDETQRNLKKMADRHGKEEWSLDQLKALGKKLSGSDKKSQRVDELGNSLMPGGQRPLKLAEQDFILNPHDVRRSSLDIVPKIDPRQDREIEMACSDLFQAAKNAREVMQLIKSIPEEVGLEAWVQEKIIKASDYLNTVREYLEGQQAKSMMSGTVSLGNMLDESTSENPLESALTRRIMSQHTDVLQRFGPVAVTQAIEDVASDYSPDDELGTSDVSAYVRRVLSYLDNNFDDRQVNEDADIDSSIKEIKKQAIKLAKSIGGDENAEQAIDAVTAEINGEVSESVALAATTALAAGGASVAGMIAVKLVSMIQQIRDRVADKREERQRLESELAKVQQYLVTQGA
jgi:hypothetical protein